LERNQLLGQIQPAGQLGKLPFEFGNPPILDVLPGLAPPGSE
jgi:hypothetical protein